MRDEIVSICGEGLNYMIDYYHGIDGELELYVGYHIIPSLRVQNVRRHGRNQLAVIMSIVT